MSVLALTFDRGDGPLMLTTREVAQVTNKLHMNVVRDAKAMIIALYADHIVKRTIPASLASRPSVFIRDSADAILCELSEDASNWMHPAGGVAWERDTRGYISNITMDYSHALTLVTGYDVVRRKALIDYCAKLEAEARAKVAPIVSHYASQAEVSALRSEFEALKAQIASRPVSLPRPGKPAIADRIAAFLRKHGEATRSAILREFRDLSAAELNSVLDRLGIAGHVAVVLVKQHGSKYGRPAEVCRWLQ